MDEFVQVNAPWSQKHGAIGKVVAEENDEVVVNLGDPLMNHRFRKTEVIDARDKDKDQGTHHHQRRHVPNLHSEGP